MEDTKVRVALREAANAVDRCRYGMTGDTAKDPNADRCLRALDYLLTELQRILRQF